jgi:hypothetical protein
VVAPIAWNLVNLRAETRAVAYLNDSSVHEQMVRFAELQFRAGHLPLTSWWPYLGLGSPQFLHYQSLPAMLTGLAGLAVGPDVAFRWTLYFLLSLWPLSIYLAARLLGADRWSGAASAAMSPFLSSAVGIGYEQKAYLWVGYGVWTQLWASFTLPLAWGLSWRAIRDGRRFLPAVALVSLTIALHFETGYLALMPLLLWPLVSRRPIMVAARRSAVVLAGSLLACAWVIAPVLAQRNWAGTNEILQGTPLVNGYGLKVLGWLGTGDLLDAGRLPVVSVFAALGLVLALRRWRSDDTGRALVAVLVGCILLSLGRTALGPLVDIVPGHADLFVRRFMMGVQLAALLLAGVGAAACLRAAWAALARLLPAAGRRPVHAAVALGAAVLVLAPAWLQLDRYSSHNAAAIDYQRRAQASEGAEVDRLLAVVGREEGGRVYAGMPSNWGADLRVGAVPVFKYLESRDVDEVGYTLRTASLMTDPEYYFDQDNPSDYALFGVRYLILPAGWASPVRARLVMRSGPYALWSVAGSGYVHAGRIVGSLTADRTDVGSRSIPLLRSALAEDGDYLRVAYGGAGRGAARRLPTAAPASTTGDVVSERDDLVQGSVAATVRMRRAGVVVLSASFDPGWTATVDGRPVKTEMVAPALVAVRVPAGTARISFRYRGFADYALLFVLSGVTLAALLTADVVRRRTRRQQSRNGLSTRTPS